jgi:hypothetical protein
VSWAIVFSASVLLAFGVTTAAKLDGAAAIANVDALGGGASDMVDFLYFWIERGINVAWFHYHVLHHAWARWNLPESMQQPRGVSLMHAGRRPYRFLLHGVGWHSGQLFQQWHPMPAALAQVYYAAPSR